MKRSVVIPFILLIYLGVMSYIGRGEFLAGHYLFYFGVIGLTLVVIYLLHLTLKKRERMREQSRKNNKEE